MTQQQGTSTAGTVQIRVQVVDVEAKALDLVVPTYIPVRDLTARIARDANLGAFWEDGARRHYWLRARGRVLREDERLDSLGVIANELLHLLPQPPQPPTIIERQPDYSDSRGYAGAGWLGIAVGGGLLLAWTTGFSIAATVSTSMFSVILPSIGLSLLSVSFARHLWGGVAVDWKTPVTGFGIFFFMMLFGLVPAAIITKVGIPNILGMAGLGFVFGVLGTITGWLAWRGAVESLPKSAKSAISGSSTAHVAGTALVGNCGVCGGSVQGDVAAACHYNCGMVFHSGCYQASQAASVEGSCHICGRAV